MFNFLFKKNNTDTKNIRAFKDAIKAIKVFILVSKWDKAKNSIEEIEKKEKIWLSRFLLKYWNEDSAEAEKIRNNLIINHKKRLSKLNELKNFLIKKENEYNKKNEKARFKIRIQKVENEIKYLIWNKKYSEALKLLQSFLEKNKNSTYIINFYNKQKKEILNNRKKENLKEQKLLEKNVETEALELIWEKVNIDKKSYEESSSFLWLIKRKLNFYKDLKENIIKKRLLDEINMLIEEDSKFKNDLASEKLANIHKWLIKEIQDNKMLWYEIYWKILWADKISWDTFWIYKSKLKYNFFLWDATWHGLKAWLIISLLSKLFNENVSNNKIQTLSYEINNWLKQSIESKNFITWVFFEINKNEINRINFVWMWHEPMLLYKNNEKITEKIIPGWLAAWIRMIKNKSDVKVKYTDLSNGDILMIYSDWIIECRNEESELYWIERLKNTFQKVATFEKNIKKIYEHIINDIQIFIWGSNFSDDTSVLLIKREKNNDIQTHWSKYLKDISIKEWLTKENIKKLEWKTKEEIDKKIEEMVRSKEIKSIIKNLENLFYTWELLKLKQEAIRFIKKWFIHKKINYYLKKAIENEKGYKIEQKDIKLKNRYNILKELEKKWDYDAVINEINEIIAQDWNY
jgi:serine phosphatase RsbU (regulator of sigma subunit)